MAHATIELEGGEQFTPLRVCRLRGGYKLLVTAERSVYQEYCGRYTLLATGQTWRDRCPLDDTITRDNACRAANFFGYPVS